MKRNSYIHPKEMVMKDQLISAIDGIEAAKTTFVQLLEGYSRAERAKLPESGWSMLQVMEHLLIAEQGVLEYLIKKCQAPYTDIPPYDASTSPSNLLKEALLSEKKFQAPEIMPDPTGAQSFENMQIYWDNLRLKFIRFVEGLDENYHNRLIFKHPTLGRLNLIETLEFIDSHITHHIYQIKRNAQMFSEKA